MTHGATPSALSRRRFLKAVGAAGAMTAAPVVIPCTAFLNYIDMSGMHRNDGVLVMTGPHIRKDHRILRAHVVDITPTILHLLDLPVGGDMDGRPILSAIEGSWRSSHPVSFVDTYENERYHLGQETGFDSITFQEKSMVTGEIKMQLQTLGYIQ